MWTTSSTGGETHILAGAAEVRVTAAVMEEKSGMLELDTIELVMPRLVRLITFYDFAAINPAADAAGGAALKPVLRMPQ